MACLSSSASLIPLFLRHYIRNQETIFCTVGQSTTRTSKGKFAIAQILIVSHVLPQTAHSFMCCHSSVDFAGTPGKV